MGMASTSSKKIREGKKRRPIFEEMIEDGRWPEEFMGRPVEEGGIPFRIPFSR
jgi:hypothetical protein